MATWLDLLRGSEFLQRLDSETLSRLAAACIPKTLRRGDQLFEPGDPRDTFYVVAYGRLGVWSGRRRVGEARTGQCVGDLAVLRGGHHSVTVRAERDTQLLCLPASIVEEALSTHPRELLKLAASVTDRLLSSSPLKPPRPSRAIAVIPLFDHPEVGRFCLSLQAELRQRHSSALFPPSDHVPDPSWFDQQEARFSTVVYQCSPHLDPWSERCLRQADRILILGTAKNPQPPSVLERLWADIAQNPERPLLVLLGSGKRRGTSQWLESRPPLGVHHLNWGQNPRRIARFLDGSAVGLVLGGGGARGLAHVGVLRALQERGLEVDLVCGTSMGGFVAALHATGRPAQRVESDLRWAWTEAGPFLDFTFPLYSVIKGERMLGRLRRLLGTATIEDLPMPFFCMSADITHARSVVHDKGPLVQWLAVGMSVPGVAPPFPYKGSLLLDGGLLNNLPVDIAVGYDCGKIIAVNVDPKDDLAVDPQDFEGSFPQQLWRRLKGQATAPHIFEILVRVTTLSNAASVARLQNTIDHYIQPDTGRYGLFDFHEANAIIEAGYQAAITHPF